MSTYAIWFDDVTMLPERLPGSIQSRGLPAAWLSPLLGLAKVRQVRHLPEDREVVTGLLVDMPDEIGEQFCEVLRSTAEHLGTVARIRNYFEEEYQLAWDSRL